MKIEIRTIKIPKSSEVNNEIGSKYKYESTIEMTPHKETIVMRIRTITKKDAISQSLLEASQLYTYFGLGVDNTLPDNAQLLAIDNKIKKYNENIIKIGNNKKDESN